MPMNPFTLKEIPAGSAFCDWQKELDESLFQKAIRFLTSFRPVLSPSPGGGVSVSVQPAHRFGPWELLDNTMEAVEKFAQVVPNFVNVALDEFQEITEIEGSLRVEGRLRHHIQRMKGGFVFVGSRRRILLEMFNDRKRPYSVKPLCAATGGGPLSYESA